MQWIGCLLVSKGPNTPKKRGASTTCLDEIQAKLWHSIHKTISGPTYFLCLQLHLHSNSWLPNGIVQVCLQLPKQLERWRIFKQNDKTGNADWSALSLGSIQQLLIFCVDHGKPRFFWSAHAEGKHLELQFFIESTDLRSRALLRSTRPLSRSKQGFDATLQGQPPTKGRYSAAKKLQFFPPDF